MSRKQRMKEARRVQPAESQAHRPARSQERQGGPRHGRSSVRETRRGLSPLAWALVGLTALAALGLFGFLRNVRNVPYPLEKFPIQSKAHIPTVATSHDPYTTDPPTSGPHVELTVPAGFYTEPFPPEILVHNLEHSHVVIYYRPDLGDAEKGELGKVADASKSKGPYSSVVIVPRAGQKEDVVLTAWGRLLKLAEYNQGSIQRFVKEHSGRGHF